jgi:hypothetical protein
MKDQATINRENYKKKRELRIAHGFNMENQLWEVKGCINNILELVNMKPEIATRMLKNLKRDVKKTLKKVEVK